jgi:hypothetical protein
MVTLFVRCNSTLVQTELDHSIYSIRSRLVYVLQILDLLASPLILLLYVNNHSKLHTLKLMTSNG